MSCSPTSKKKKVDFTRYREHKTFGSVYQITPDDGYYLHSFFDVLPFSPSGRYVAVTKIPSQDSNPQLGDTSEICIIDLHKKTIESIYTTRAWGMQVGANLNWGMTDKYIYSNDIIDGQTVCIRINIESRVVRAYSGSMYHLSPDELEIIGFPLELMNATQPGYGVPVEEGNQPVLTPEDYKREGLWRTSLDTDNNELLVSIYDTTAAISNKNRITNGTYYFFHSKYNRQNSRIMQVLRYVYPTHQGKVKRKNRLFTFNVDGSKIVEAVSAKQWSRGGNHPNWHPDGKHLVMNLTVDDEIMRFCSFKYDGSDLKVLSKSHPGSGHPSISPNGRYLVTDAYPHEPLALENGEVPIRLLDLQTDSMETICTMFTLGDGRGVVRCDPHPVWSKDGKKICFNGAHTGRRQVYIADLSSVLA